MSRSLRIEFSGALHHVTSRRDRREDIVEDDEDRLLFLSTLGDVVRQFNWVCHAYCLMGDHYHLVLETLDANLSKGMRQLNGVYTQATNRRHRRVGHLFQGRFKAILVDRDAYLLELTRYVVLNPVRARMVKRPVDWKWSSHRAMLGLVEPQPWLATDALLTQFASRRSTARERYQEFVKTGLKAPSIWSDLKNPVFLGDEQFVERMQKQVPQALQEDLQVPRGQRRKAPPSLAQIASRFKERNKAIVAAHATGQYSYQQIGGTSACTSRRRDGSCGRRVLLQRAEPCTLSAAPSP